MTAGVMHLFRRRRIEGSRAGGASFSVDGLAFTEFTVLRKSTGSVLSQAGQLSWRSKLEGRPVKISEYPSEDAARLLEAACANATLARHFPPIVRRAGRYVVADWVEGETVSASSVARDGETLAEIATIQARLHAFRPPPGLRETMPSYREVLWSRFDKYAGIVPFERFAERILASLDAAERLLEPAPSHPDITPVNLIRAAQTGELLVIDNELIGAHRFAHADLLNTYHALRRYESTDLADRYLSAYESAAGDLAPLAAQADAYGALWALRVAGSDLQRGAVDEAIATADAYLEGRLAPHPLVERVTLS